jgi:Flp pilus assembly protein TadB
MRFFSSPTFLPACILAGVGVIFLVLAFTLPLMQVVALVAGTALVVGLVLARLRRDMDGEPVRRTARFGAQG